MSMESQVRRLGRVRQKIRTDLWPDPPQLPESFVKRFPELRQFNEDIQQWNERIRNASEIDPEDL